ncbi:hypothetical protein BIFCAT_02009 [Bifidobacterium catenulatum DSM 16992 = JCM 1194 = LMG 11043]|uniref:Uncharacterized protein n=1 Tax=Bifidobacterium catenulatum DSM 16992 = JCM 1194 = LMG 11043 TaxID=566552 RepID=B6XXP9_9BIFI|nr:hypothetical protein BIFCAT_02009 [Bifidobacterium catenulatum DSM 16992 = JCM 1194 = LMG 11043]
MKMSTFFFRIFCISCHFCCRIQFLERKKSFIYNGFIDMNIFAF